MGYRNNPDIVGEEPRKYSSRGADEIDSATWSRPTKSELAYWNKQIAKLEAAEGTKKKKRGPKKKSRKPKKPPLPRGHTTNEVKVSYLQKADGEVSSDE